MWLRMQALYKPNLITPVSHMPRRSTWEEAMWNSVDLAVRIPGHEARGQPRRRRQDRGVSSIGWGSGHHSHTASGKMQKSKAAERR